MHSSLVCRIRLVPKRPLPDLSLKIPTSEQLAKVPRSGSKHPILPHVPPPKLTKMRFFNELPVLPTSYSQVEAKTDVGPAKYFEISLRRSLIGLPHQTKTAVHALGLKRRHHRIWQPINHCIGGKILRIKELVDVKTVAEIPRAPVYPTGYKKVASLLQ